MSVTNSPNMNLPVPGVGSEPGPDYANDVNSCLAIIDQHDHSTGSGVPITPSGININTALTLNNNFLTHMAGSTFQAQSSTPAINTAYVNGVDLYFVDGLGNNVRLTQSGAVAGSPGSISNLVSPASASYVSGSSTFVWQSNTNIAANMDFGSALLRNLSPNSTYALTLQPPAALGANYSLTLPSLPASQKFMTLDNTGAMSAPWAVDASTIVVSSNVVKVPASGITSNELAANSVITAKINDGAVTNAKLAALGQQISSSCGSFTSASGSYTDVTNLSVTITTTGRPVYVMVIPDGNGVNLSFVGSDNSGALSSSGPDMNVKILRDAAASYEFKYADLDSVSPNSFIKTGVGSICVLDATPIAGSHTYKIQVQAIGGIANLAYARLVAFEA